jgi:hypothetical protein
MCRINGSGLDDGRQLGRPVGSHQLRPMSLILLAFQAERRGYPPVFPRPRPATDAIPHDRIG